MAENTDNSYDRIIPLPPSIYFGGASCAVPYHIGVVKAMKEIWSDDFHKDIIVCGDSIGSIVALQICLGFTVEEIDAVFREIGKNMIDNDLFTVGHNYYLDAYVEKLLQQRPNVYKEIEGKFMCGRTKHFAQYEVSKEWVNNADLAKTLKASYNIPLYCTRCEPVEGEQYVDGAFGMDADLLPHGDGTLFVGLNKSTADINANISNFDCLIPDIGEKYDRLFKLGYDAMYDWDGKLKDKIGVHIPNYAALVFCWFGKTVQQCIYTVKNIFVDEMFDCIDDADFDNISQSENESEKEK